MTFLHCHTILFFSTYLTFKYLFGAGPGVYLFVMLVLYKRPCSCSMAHVLHLLPHYTPPSITRDFRMEPHLTFSHTFYHTPLSYGTFSHTPPHILSPSPTPHPTFYHLLPHPTPHSITPTFKYLLSHPTSPSITPHFQMEPHLTFSHILSHHTFKWNLIL